MTQREAIDKALKKHETNCCMFERGVQTLDDLLASRTVFLGVLQAAQAQAAVESVKSASGAILGVRVHGDTVIIKIRGGQRWGNQWARELCHKILTNREHEPGGNLTALNKWS
jgi:hypothetical protein